jgi:hypothetical protein
MKSIELSRRFVFAERVSSVFGTNMPFKEE